MPELPRGAVYIDLLVPEGTSSRVDDLQTRLDLVAAGDWRVLTDDGSMERSSQPMQPLRGSNERLWVVRSHPFTPTDNLQTAASLAVELAGMASPRLAAVGVSGLYSWGFVLVDDFHSLFGLLLLDWLYNPRLSAHGEVLETEDPATIEAEFRAKGAAFGKLWRVEHSQQLMSQLPPGVLQPVESYQALSLLGPGGRFDPRLWQGLAMQLVLPGVKMLSSDATSGSAAASQPPEASHPSAAPAQSSGAAAASIPPSESSSGGSRAQTPPADGMTPLARAQLEAERRSAAGEEAPPQPQVEELASLEGAVSWHETARGPLLFLSRERFDADLIRACQGGDFAGLQRSERPTGQQQELWSEAGSPFVAEVPSFSSLFLDGVPLHRGAFEAAAVKKGSYSVLSCQLQRVCRVQAVLDQNDSGDRRIIVCSETSISPSDVLRLSSP